MEEKIDILDIPVDNVTMQEALIRISQFVASATVHTVFTPNPEIIMLAQKNERFYHILKNASLVVPDGIGVVIASKIKKGTALQERVAGYDLVQNTMKQAVDKGYRYYFLGSKPGVAKQAAKKMEEIYPGIQIVGTHDGYFKPEDNLEIVESINQSQANIVLVALGAPRQEIWIDENKHLLKHVKVLIGVGGSLDVMAGVAKRAPVIFQKIGLEWFYRLISQPTRIKRMAVLPQFMLHVMLSKKQK